ncbi:hypothetical protein Tco_1139249, partial [Tanacetum coccineum]
DEDSEASGPASDAVTYLDERDRDHMTSYTDSNLGFEAHGDDQHKRNSSYRTVPLHDPFDFYLFTDEAIVDFVNKYDDLYETSESLEGGKAKISLNKEPEIRDSDGNAMPSSDTSEDSDSGREADEVDPHTRTGSEDENRTTACQGRDENRHADFEALGSASWDGISPNKELQIGEWDGSPVTRLLANPACRAFERAR